MFRRPGWSIVIARHTLWHDLVSGKKFITLGLHVCVNISVQSLQTLSRTLQLFATIMFPQSIINIIA